MRIPGSLAASFLLVATCTGLSADTIVLKNGDLLTGTIERLEDGKVRFDSPLLGTLSVKWKDIQSVSSEATFSVRTSEGRVHEGTVARDGAVTSLAADGLALIAVPSESIDTLARRQRRSGLASLATAFDGSADIGYSVARGNQRQTQSSLGAAAEYLSARYRIAARLDSLFARQDGARSQSRHALNMRLDRFLGASLFTYGLSDFERNERRRLDFRSRLGGGVGWRLFDSGGTRVSALSGFAYVHEQFRELDDRAAVETFAGGEWETKLFGDSSLEMQLTLHQDLADRGRVRVQYDGAVRIPIASRFIYSLRFFDRYDTRPPQTVKRNDYGIVSGLGIAF